MSTDTQTILKLRVPLMVEIGRRNMKLEAVLNLAQGSIIELNKHADEPLDVVINNHRIGEGHAVKVGENFGIRIEDVGEAKELIEAMGSS